MVYSGGVLVPNASWEQIAPIYGFLRQALRLVDHQTLYRGPNRYEQNNYVYENEYYGTLGDFYGNETILIDGQRYMSYGITAGLFDNLA